MVSAVSEDDEETICMKPEVLVTTSSAENGKLDEYSDSFMSSSIIGQASLSYFFFLFYHLDIANLCLQAQKMPKFSLIILSILSLDDKHGGSQKNYLQAMAQNTNLIAK